MSISTLTNHANHTSKDTDVSPALHVSTTFRYPRDPAKLKTGDSYETKEEAPLVYSRCGTLNVVDAENVIGKFMKAKAVLYSSGLSAIYALLCYLNPKHLYIAQGYHGSTGVAKLISSLSGMVIHPLDEVKDKVEERSLVWVETPINPLGECSDLSFYSKVAKESNAILGVDSTFAPPPLSDPFVHGADYVIHSATKYFGGHSDLLAGLILTKSAEAQETLLYQRTYLGTICASLEAFLLLRSLKTLELRVKAQSENALKIVSLLQEIATNEEKAKELGIRFGVVVKVHHSSLQKESFVTRQMTGGHCPVFSLILESVDIAKRIASSFEYFEHATSLGGTESLVEWRRMSDEHADARLLRFSIGVESFEDLSKDLIEALRKVS